MSLLSILLIVCPFHHLPSSIFHTPTTNNYNFCPSSSSLPFLFFSLTLLSFASSNFLHLHPHPRPTSSVDTIEGTFLCIFWNIQSPTII
ncbi:hypothetical protein DFP73DRAFT_536372 [Morchella snyderi]|nr:hypothetical protein DFP73DRAFT_536372 [Morchella snyderi]